MIVVVHNITFVSVITVDNFKIFKKKTYYSATSHIRAVWDQGGSVIVKVPVSMNPLLPVYTLRHFTL